MAEAYLYETVAHLAANKWNDKHNVGLVVGATDVEAIKNVRNVAPNMWMLVPGKRNICIGFGLNQYACICESILLGFFFHVVSLL